MTRDNTFGNTVRRRGRPRTIIYFYSIRTPWKWYEDIRYVHQDEDVREWLKRISKFKSEITKFQRARTTVFCQRRPWPDLVKGRWCSIISGRGRAERGPGRGCPRTTNYRNFKDAPGSFKVFQVNARFWLALRLSELLWLSNQSESSSF